MNMTKKRQASRQHCQEGRVACAGLLALLLEACGAEGRGCACMRRFWWMAGIRQERRTVYALSQM